MDADIVPHLHADPRARIDAVETRLRPPHIPNPAENCLYTGRVNANPVPIQLACHACFLKYIIANKFG